MSEVSILIKAVDEATAVLKSVKGQIGGLDEAGKKASSETGGLNNLNAKMAALGANLTSVGQNLSTFATVPLVAAGAGFIKLASDAQET